MAGQKILWSWFKKKKHKLLIKSFSGVLFVNLFIQDYSFLM